jgi:hypothetical protein
MTTVRSIKTIRTIVKTHWVLIRVIPQSLGAPSPEGSQTNKLFELPRGSWCSDMSIP